MGFIRLEYYNPLLDRNEVIYFMHNPHIEIFLPVYAVIVGAQRVKWVDYLLYVMQSRLN